MRLLIRIIDWIGRAFDFRDLIVMVVGSSFVTGSGIAYWWDLFKTLPGPTQWLYGAGAFLTFLAIGGYLAQMVRKPEGPFLFNTEHFLKSIFVIDVRASQKKLDGPTPHVMFAVQIVNGSGFPIEINKEIMGHMQVRGTFLQPAEFVSSMGHLNLTMPYPKNGHYEIRQFLDPDLLATEIAFANAPDARSADRMFGTENDPGPNIMFDMKELQLQVIARKGQLSHEFQMPLFNHSVIVVL
jgi:hypothetical protein